MKITIPIDHGNRLIKTLHHSFPSAFMENAYLPSIGGDVLKYNGKAYTLVNERLPVQNDKSEDERYFILTLFALGKELREESDMVRKLTPSEPIKVELLIGLPLQHFMAYKKKFEGYFLERTGVIKYEFNGKPYSIQLIGATAFPQAYAAAITAYDRLKDSRVVNIIDLGGFTVDCLQLNQFNPNMALCTSLYWGVNTLCQGINERVRGTGASMDISDDVIERILRKEPDALSEYSQARIETVTSTAVSHVNRMLAEISQKGFDLAEDKTVFMGGGSILLKEYILKANKAKKPIFIDDIHANAKGFQLIYDMQNGAGKKNHGA
ncbi:MAG: ParM/StbA family protein [Defluviitaleaceae bacterium]|nr:ParM/StbA family protein [Defluviitaleaceae bacterium]